ncbi:MAG: peptidoglycan DD-metalloendopeptidase family protein [Bacilli bacterium]
MVEKEDSARRKRDIRPEYSVAPDDDLYGSPRSWTGAQWSTGKGDPTAQETFQAGVRFAAQEEDEPFLLKSRPPHTDFPPTSALIQDRELYRRSADTLRKRRGPSDAQTALHERGASTWTLQILASAFLLGATALMFHSEQPIALQARHDIRQLFALDYLQYAPGAVTSALGVDAAAHTASHTATIGVTAQPLDIVAPISGSIARAFSVISPDIVLHGRPGSIVVAATDGLVVAAGESQASGSYVMIDHGAFGQTFYAHLGKVVVHAQEYVSAGETIGYLPETSGNLTFGYIRGGSYRDPKAILGLAK